jgi:hypothetical protein
LGLGFVVVLSASTTRFIKTQDIAFAIVEGNSMTSTKISYGVLIALVATASFLTVLTAGLLSTNQAVPSSGTIAAVGVSVYSDSSCTENLMSINWGTISPGDNVTTTIYVKNTGNVSLTLTMTTTNWNPSTANGPIAIAWDVENWVVGAGNVVTAELTLNVSSSISDITDFSVDIVITGTE